MANALKQLQEFERRSDAAVAELSLWGKPIRSILSFIYLSADGQFVGRRFNRKGLRNDDVGTAIITRMSYAVGFFGNCPREIGAHIDDALSVVDRDFQKDIEQLFAYTHFCEIMPLIWRGFFAVERRPSAFVLRHQNDEFAKYEEADILMSEMGLPHDLVLPPYQLDSCRQMIKAWPKIPGDALIKVLKDAYDHYIVNIFELPLLDDKAFEDGFNFLRADFIRIRAALMAYADFCLGMADAAELLSLRAVTRPRREAMQREVREWAAPLLKRNHIIGVAAGLAGVEASAAERIVNLFTLNLDDLEGSGAGEGFFPPFLRLGDALLFSPHAIKRMMPERNLLYTMVQTDKKKFDNVVSSHLEPALVENAAAVLSGLPGVEIKKNVCWTKGGIEGEIDLLAYHEASNSAIQLQAKASVPPQGARMVAQVESRTIEAKEQVERFLNLSNDEKNRICSSAIGRKLSGISWCSGILVRTCLGTQKAWCDIAEYAPLNPVLLRAAVNRMSKDGEFTFLNLGGIIQEELENLRSVAVLGWENKSIYLFGETIEIPLLNLDYHAIADFRNRAIS